MLLYTTYGLTCQELLQAVGYSIFTNKHRQLSAPPSQRGRTNQTDYVVVYTLRINCSSEAARNQLV